MTQITRFVVLLPNLNGLVGFPGNQSGSGPIKTCRHDPIFGIQRPRLHNRLRGLKLVPRLVIPKLHRPIVTTTDQHTVVVDRQGIHNFGIVMAVIFQKFPIPALPLFDTIGGTRDKGIFKGRGDHGPDRFLMMRQRGLAFSGNQIPQFNGRIVTSGNDLGVGRLGENGPDGIVVSGQTVDLMFGPHIPDPGDGIAASRHQQIEGGMEGQAKDATEMPVIMSNDLIGFQIPTFDLFVFGGTEQVGMSVGKGETSNGTDMSGECELQGIAGSDGGFGKVPNLDRSVSLFIHQNSDSC